MVITVSVAPSAGLTRTIRLPARSVTHSFPSAPNSISHGPARPDVTTRIVNRSVPSPVPGAGWGTGGGAAGGCGGRTACCGEASTHTSVSSVAIIMCGHCRAECGPMPEAKEIRPIRTDRIGP